MRLIICRTRQLVGCNAILQSKTESGKRFNAARGKWSVATPVEFYYQGQKLAVSMPHAASGQLQLRTYASLHLDTVLVSMPHAASGRLQLHDGDTLFSLIAEFQCRTRQVVGCNVIILVLLAKVVQVSMPHAAGGRLQRNLTHHIWLATILFQCRTRQVVGCNKNW